MQQRTLIKKRIKEEEDERDVGTQTRKRHKTDAAIGTKLKNKRPAVERVKTKRNREK